MTITKRIVVLAALLALVGITGCNRPAHEGKVLATVNGAPITDVDLELTTVATGHGPEKPKKDLEYVIAEELFYQQGQKLGLDNDPGYRKQLAQLEKAGHGLAKDTPWHRQYVAQQMRGEMARRIFDTQIAAKVEVRMAEAREYFDRNRERMATELHLGALRYQTAGEAQQALQKLRKGESFETLAAEQKKKAPEAHCGDLGFFSWQQIPIDYGEKLYKMKPGECTEVLGNHITGYQIFKVYGSRKSANEVRFSEFSATVMNGLRDLKLIEEHARYLEKLKKQAKIVTF
jgi:peptidyl-prolyl cis-trans isomerase C